MFISIKKLLVNHVVHYKLGLISKKFTEKR